MVRGKTRSAPAGCRGALQLTRRVDDNRDCVTRIATDDSETNETGLPVTTLAAWCSADPYMTPIAPLLRGGPVVNSEHESENDVHSVHSPTVSVSVDRHGYPEDRVMGLGGPVPIPNRNGYPCASVSRPCQPQ